MEKKTLTIGCLGHQGHGKTSLMVAMAARAKALNKTMNWPYCRRILGNSNDPNSPTLNDMIDISEKGCSSSSHQSE